MTLFLFPLLTFNYRDFSFESSSCLVKKKKKKSCRFPCQALEINKYLESGGKYLSNSHGFLFVILFCSVLFAMGETSKVKLLYKCIKKATLKKEAMAIEFYFN